MVESDITTSIDALVKYVDEHGETEGTALASALNVSERTIEEWTNILEKANIIKISYKVGKMYVSRVGMSKEKVQAIANELSVKKSTLQNEVSSNTLQLNKMSAKIDEYNKFITDAEKMFKTKLGGTKESIDKIEAFERQVSEAHGKLMEKKSNLDKLSQTLNTDLETLQKRLDKVENFSLDVGNAREVIDDIRKKVTASEEGASGLLKKFDEMAEQHRKSIVASVQSVRQEIKTLREIAAQEEKQLESYERDVKTYKREAAASKQKRHREGERLKDETTKTKQEIDRIYSTAENEITKINAILSASKAAYGELPKMSRDLKDIKDSIAEMIKDRDKLAKDLADLTQELRAFELLSQDKVTQKVEIIEKAKQDAEDANVAISDIAKKSRDVEKDINDVTS